MPSDAAAPLVFTLEFLLKDAGGKTLAQGNARGTLQGEALTLLTDRAATIRIMDRDVDAVREEGRDIHLRLAAGSELILSKAGREHEACVRLLTEFCDRGLIRDLLMEEAEIFPMFEARAALADKFGVRRSEFGEGAGDSKLETRNPKPASAELCRCYLFESGLVIFRNDGDPVRIPLGIVAGVREEGLNVAVELDDGGVWTFSALARSRDPFRNALSRGLDALQTRMQEALRAAFPALDPASIPALSMLFKDGRTVFKDEAESASPGLWAALEKAWAASEAVETYAALASRAKDSPIAFGIKHGLWGDLDGDYLFCLIPGLGELLSWESTRLGPKEESGETEGLATYFFRREAGGEWKREVHALALRLLMINFRREPIYLAQDKLEDATHAQTARAVRHLEALRILRKQFSGRAIHTTPEGWRKSVETIITSQGKEG
jgi:hypothetical protein